MSIKTDKEIIDAIRLGKDDKAIAALYKDVMPGVIRYIGKFGGSKEEACDIFQDALMNFYRNVVNGNFKEQKYKVHGYIFTVSKNLWINRVQMTKRMVVMENEDMQFVVSDEKSILDCIMGAERDALINTMFAQLDKKCFDLLTLSVYNKFSMKEIAIKMGMTSDNVAKVNNYRCKQKLVELVKSHKDLKSMLQ